MLLPGIASKQISCRYFLLIIFFFFSLYHAWIVGWFQQIPVQLLAIQLTSSCMRTQMIYCTAITRPLAIFCGHKKHRLEWIVLSTFPGSMTRQERYNLHSVVSFYLRNLCYDVYWSCGISQQMGPSNPVPISEIVPSCSTTGLARIQSLISSFQELPVATLGGGGTQQYGIVSEFSAHAYIDPHRIYFAQHPTKAQPSLQAPLGLDVSLSSKTLPSINNKQLMLRISPLIVPIVPIVQNTSLIPAVMLRKSFFFFFFVLQHKVP